ncbi:hypothetical protein TcasGA2_TC000437 [Tribolium castaneum]|uniref:Uncharacterized protein n=1 Tax=Tribolium castaneum TaxID=7070 RepID=D6WAA3_TRICA|nr:hypothetical protein TcasGA2_TC000437 [Tribolium castaneum]
MSLNKPSKLDVYLNSVQDELTNELRHDGIRLESLPTSPRHELMRPACGTKSRHTLSLTATYDCNLSFRRRKFGVWTALAHYLSQTRLMMEQGEEARSTGRSCASAIHWGACELVRVVGDDHAPGSTSFPLQVDPRKRRLPISGLMGPDKGAVHQNPGD